LKVTFLPHAIEQMAEREIPEERARAVLEEPDGEYPGDTPERTVAERTFEGERSAIKVVYTVGLEDERVVVSVFRGRPKFPRAAGGEGR
jgi:hypothetical protein